MNPCPCCQAAPIVGESLDTEYSISCENGGCPVRPLVGQKTIYSEPCRRTPEEVETLWDSLDANSAVEYGRPLSVAFAKIARDFNALPQAKKDEVFRILSGLFKEGKTP